MGKGGRLFSKAENRVVAPVSWGAVPQRQTPWPGDQHSRQVKREEIAYIRPFTVHPTQLSYLHLANLARS